MESSTLIETAARYVNNTRQHLFLTGKAGTGKTTFLRELVKNTYKKHIVVAPTGIAALHAGGTTIHSQFLLPLGTFIPTEDAAGNISETARIYTQNTLARKHPLNAARKKVLREIDLLIIDEVSMLRADVLDAIDYRLKAARRNFNEAFGGVQLLLIGDLFQLPPVVKEQEWNLLRSHYNSAFFFDSLAIKGNFVYIELDKIFRQKDDDFIQILNNLRNDSLTQQDVETLNKFYLPEAQREQLKDIITLTTHNHRADKINNQALDNLPGKLFTYEATIDKEFPESMYPVDPSIQLKEGAQVMFIKNDTVNNMYFNGKLAKVTELTSKSITVLIDGQTEPYKLEKHQWENKKYTIDEESKELEEETVGTFGHYPIKLAWAITVHKSQGLTFDKAIIDVGKAFAPGQVYVALSRLRSLDGLVLGTPINPAVVSNDDQILSFSQNKASNDQLNEWLTQAQQEYIYHLLHATFDFDPILIEINTIERKFPTFAYEDPSIREAIPNVRKRFQEHIKTTATFRSQLNRLIRENESVQLLNRINKGSDFYKTLFFDSIETLLSLIEELSAYSKTKTFTTALEELDLVITKKLSQILAIQEITESILKNEEVSKNNKPQVLIANRRAALLKDIRLRLEASGKKSAKKSGKRRTTSSSSGPLGETYLKTLEMVREGNTPEDIANKRGLSESTVLAHLSKLIANGKVEAYEFMGREHVDTLLDAIKQLSFKSLSELKAKLDDSYSYEEIRLVLAQIQWEKSKDIKTK